MCVRVCVCLGVRGYGCVRVCVRACVRVEQIVVVRLSYYWKSFLETDTQNNTPGL